MHIRNGGLMTNRLLFQRALNFPFSLLIAIK